MAKTSTRGQIGYVQKETSYGVIPNTTGTPTLAGTDAFVLTTISMKPAQPINVRPDKNSSLSKLAGTPGRKAATWSTTCSLAGSGTAGTAPDIDVILAALFGKDSTSSAGVSVTYAFEDASPTFSLWDFVATSTSDQQVSLGSIVQQGRFDFGGNFATFSASGESKWVLTKAQMATIIDGDGGKGGLTGTTYPSAPSPTTAGNAVAGYKGTITLDGNAYTTVRSGSVIIAVARELDKQNWDDDYPGSPVNGDRTVTVDLTLTDDDSANLAALKGKAYAHTAVDFSLQIGKVAGNICTFGLKRIQLEAPEYGEDGNFRTTRLTGYCVSSAVGAKDEATLVLT